MNRLLRFFKLSPKVRCFIGGHLYPIPMLYETDNFIYTCGCPRCHSALGVPVPKNIPPPPNSNGEQIKNWNKDLDKFLQDIRDNYGTDDI